MVLKTGRFALLWRILIGSGLALLFGLAIALRVSLYQIETSDYNVFLSQWYEYIQTHGGLAALKDTFSNYNTPYLTLLALTTYLPIPKLIAIKTLSVVFDGVLGIFAYCILRLKYNRSLAASVGVLVLLFAPTIFINSAAWGQCDALYTAFCLGSLYFLLKRRPGWACVCFGLALAFKLQAIFFAPVLLVLLLKKHLPLRYLILIPLIFLLMLTPALIAGRNALSLLSIYTEQISSGSTGANAFNPGGSNAFTHNTGSAFTNGGPGGSGQANNNGSGSFNGNGPNGKVPAGPGSFNNGGTANTGPGGTGQFNGSGQARAGSSASSLTLNAPSFYQWLPTDAPANYWKWVGIALAALFILAISVLLFVNKQQLTTALLLKITLLFALAIPFLLPEMHERYFYLADVLSILYAFYFPRVFYVAIVTQLCSLLSYAPYFLQRQIVPLSYVAGAMLLLIVIVLIDLVRSLSPKPKLPLPEADVHAPPLAIPITSLD
jgi:Gpi18-like mannosyltransferase